MTLRWCYLYPLVPKPPGSIIFSSRSNSSLQQQWATPDEMIGAPDIIYSITYQAVGGLSQNTTSTQNNTLLSLLDSGTNYTVTVKTTGPGNLSSTIVQNSSFTCKYNKEKNKAVRLSVLNAWFYWPVRTLHINQYIIWVLVLDSLLFRYREEIWCEEFGMTCNMDLWCNKCKSFNFGCLTLFSNLSSFFSTKPSEQSNSQPWIYYFTKCELVKSTGGQIVLHILSWHLHWQRRTYLLNKHHQ